MLPRAGEHPVLADCVLIAFRGHEIEVLRWIQTVMKPDEPPRFGAQPILEALAMHLVRAGSAATGELVGAIAAPSLPQWCRLALMRGATRLGGGGLPESALTQLSQSAVDASVRRRASGLLDAIRRRRELRASRPPVPALSPAQVELFELGRTTYALCATCHQPDGLGRPGIAPSLHGGRWANAASPDAVIRIVLHGKEGSPGYPAPMVPLANLSDEQLAGVLTYMRRSFGNNASAVEPVEVEKTRRALSHRVNAWSDAELARIAGEH
jgi:mono/diheme cytochrome c family protein